MTAGSEHHQAGRVAVLVVLSTAAFMASLDLFIVNVAFPDIGRRFASASQSDVSWVLNGYAIVYAALLVPLGRLADRYGRLGAFRFGLVVFTAASAACACATSLWTLVFFRCLQAVGAAALTPTSLGLLLAATPPADRARAARAWATIGSLAAATGPPLAGLLVQLSWRWIFAINVPIGAATFLLARLVPDSRDRAVTRMPDLFGAGLVACGLAALALGLVNAPEWGAGSIRTLSSLGIAVVCTVAFFIRSAHHPLPVVDLSLLRLRTVAWANTAGLLYSTAFAAALLAAVLWLQDVWHWSALRTGLAITPASLMVTPFSVVAQKLSRRTSAGALAAAGCALFSTGIALIGLRIGTRPDYLTAFLPGWLVLGAGVGLAMPTIFSAATAGLPPVRAATGSGLITTARQLGLTLGVSALIMTIGTPQDPATAHHAFVPAWWGIAGVALLAALAGLAISPPRRYAPVPAPRREDDVQYARAN